MDRQAILDAIPSPSPQRIALRVTPAAERMIRQGHPWLFDQAIRHQSRAGSPGDLAVLFDQKRRFLAIGLYDPASPIRVRILQSGKSATIDQAWFRQKIITAATLRSSLNATKTTGYRLIHGENDGLSGLVVDRYDGTLVIKLYTASWIVYLCDILPLLREITPHSQVVLRASRAVQKQESALYGLKDGMILYGPEQHKPILFQENALFFEADPIRGQKTGFFLDQRDNRAKVGTLAKHKTVLNLFAYTGGFSLYAARGGAKSVVSLDVSKAALAGAERNFAHNRHHPAVAATDHQLLAADAFGAMKQMKGEGRRFDLIIIDPPAFAKQQSEIQRALSAYAQLTRLGLALLKPNSTIVLASCSSRISPELFYETIHHAATQVGRPLREIERTAHALDHPVGFKEGRYLKCLFANA